MLIGLILAAAFLAYSNGANDNFKGVATLFGSRTLSYRRALWWATATTLAGSVASIFLAKGLIQTFSGKGLVPAATAAQPSFLLTVGTAAALTVMIATAVGMPISTTHAMTGALVGAGIFSGAVNLGQLGQAFFLPLAVSPFLSLAMTAALYPALRGARVRLGVERQMCLCVDEDVEPVRIQPDGSMVFSASGARLTAGQQKLCEARYKGRVLGFDSQRVLDWFHFLSAGLVGFARGLNDTPKIVALLAAALGAGFGLSHAMLLVGLAMAFGGLLSARKVAATMSMGITSMNHGQGFTANAVTALLVTLASRFGVPVSTTHVSCGSLFGLGAVNGTARWKMIRAIVGAWIFTLPAAAALAWAIGTLVM